jgi:hypothetical protein
VQAWTEISIEVLGVASWMLTIVVGLAIFRGRVRKLHWAALGAVFTFIGANVALGIYVVTHPGDARWDDDNPLSVASLSDTPMIGQHLQQLDSVMDDVVARVNDVRDIQQAIPVALEFFTAAGWGCLAALLVALAANSVEKMWKKAEGRQQDAEFASYKQTIEDLQQELDDVKRFVNYQNSR